MTPQEFKLAVKHRLIDLDMTEAELIAKIRERTGKYMDTSYLSRIFKGKNHPEAIIAAIQDILGLTES